MSMKAWDNAPLFNFKRDPTTPLSWDEHGAVFLDHMHRLKQKYENGVANSHSWCTYKDNIRAFTLHVGCPVAHDEPEENIKELRLFHAKQMPFFQKLQDDLQNQININSKQQEIITALSFRHLIEQLPEPRTRKEYGSSTKSTPRWHQFWDDAIKKEKEYILQGKGTHPLTALHNYMSGNQRMISDKGEVMEGPKKNQPGQLYRYGRDLFATLSTSVHKYKEGGKDAYTVRDDQWGEVCRQLLHALKPVSYTDEEVDWEVERKRYLE